MFYAGLMMMLCLACPDELDDLPLLKGGIQRISSYDRNDGDNDFYSVYAQQTLVLADIPGPGTIKRFYIKVDSNDPAHLRSLLLRFFWDGSKYPCVECPLGDFFALGNGRYYEVDSAPIVTGNQRGMTCFFPMPFNKRAYLVLANESKLGASRIYYQIDYEPRAPDKNAGLFHAVYNQAVLGSASANYLALHTEGQGKYVGLVLTVLLGEDGWFGSGDERIFLNGSNIPSTQGTGLDDLFGGAWGFRNGFCGRYFGTPYVGDLTQGSEFVGYRFHLRDAITFSKSIDVVLEHVGERFAGGKKIGDSMARNDTFFSVAYWYQRKPYEPFNRMPNVSDRIAGYRIFAVEGEQMYPAEICRNKITSVQAYGATVVRYTPEKAGDTCELRFGISLAGWYDVSGFFTRSARQGAFKVMLDDKVLAERMDFYKGEGGHGRFNTQRSDEIFFGKHNLSGGDHLLRLEALEPREEALGLLLGIDTMVFKPTTPPKEK